MRDVFYPVAHRTSSEFSKLKSRYQTFDSSVVTKIFRDTLGLTVVSIEKPESWATSHIIYDVTVKELAIPLLFRANVGTDEPEYSLKIEHIISQQLTKLGVPGPHVLAVDISRKQYPFDFQIQEVLPGYDLESGFGGTKEEYDRMSYALGKYIALYGQLSFDGFGLFDVNHIEKMSDLRGTKKTFYEFLTASLSDDLTHIVTGNLIDENVKEKILGIFETYKPVIQVDRGVLVHNDLADHNLMSNGTTITGVIDWENCCIADPVLDLASCPTWRTHHPRESQLLAGYQSITALPTHFTEKRLIYKLRTILWKTAYTLRLGMLDETRFTRLEEALSPFGIGLVK